MKQLLAIFMIGLLAFGFMPAAMADDEAVEPEAPGVAGCSSIEVDPASSLEFQQNICNSAENNPDTSCGVSGHGRCSSPKYNDVLPEGNHCICISEDEVVAPVV